MLRLRLRVWFVLCFVLLNVQPLPVAYADDAGLTVIDYRLTDNELTLTLNTGEALMISAIAPNVFGFAYHAKDAQPDARAIVLDGVAASPQRGLARLSRRRNALVFATDEMQVEVNLQPFQLTMRDQARRWALQSEGQADWPQALRFRHDQLHFYGVRGFSQGEAVLGGITRDQGGVVDAGLQGGSGGPLAFSAKFGLLVDSVEGQFEITSQNLTFAKNSRKQPEWFVINGPPKRFWESATALTGRPPMLPRWALGFINSEWGTTQAEVEQIVQRYHQSKIPIDAFGLDFDYKAWGEDNYGELRWNPATFPDGEVGRFGKAMADQHINLIGIMKPRLIIRTEQNAPTQQAQDMQRLGCELADQALYRDYFSKLPAQDVDFAKPECRAWFWQHAQHFYDTGIAGWWNDEADISEDYRFTSLQHWNMARAMYDGQRSVDDRRVFTLNRNFYFGAQRFGYALWSGDIGASFWDMADQRARMLAAINTGASWWTMDGGGFIGEPSPENYARWMMFNAVTPIMRVHGGRDAQRQPWAFGEQAEAASRSAIALRYALLPYLYGNARLNHNTGVGLVRPMFYEFPDDPIAATLTEQWMLGEAILVAPIVEEARTTQPVYLPAGEWIDYVSGARYRGPGWLTMKLDPSRWDSLPMFVRAGAIVPMSAGQPQTAAQAAQQVEVHLFPGRNASGSFELYHDDGGSYGYERGEFFAQRVTQQRKTNTIQIDFGSAWKGYAAPSKTILLQVHDATAREVRWRGNVIPQVATVDALRQSEAMGWAVGKDPYGPLTLLRVPLGEAGAVLLSLARAPQTQPPQPQPLAAPSAHQPAVIGPVQTCDDAKTTPRNTPRNVRREVWADIGGAKTLTSVLSLPAFPAHPSQIEAVPQLDGYYGSGQNFGQRMMALLCVPVTGAYVFSLAANDQAQLWLSTDETQAQRRLIASVNDWTYYREWGRVPEQQSTAITLEAGRRYYIEVLHKADGSEDHVAVGWRGPGLTRRPIMPNDLLAFRP